MSAIKISAIRTPIALDPICIYWHTNEYFLADFATFAENKTESNIL